MEAKLIEPRLAKLFELCLEHGATYLTQEDMSLDWFTNLMPEEVGEMIEQNLPEYAPISVYSAPRKEGDDRVHVLVVGKKDDQSYSLLSGAIPKGDYETCMALLREAAQKRMQPWSYWEPCKRGWTIAAGVVAISTAALMVYMYSAPPDEVSTDVWLLLIGATLASGLALSMALFFLPKVFWEDRAQDIEKLLDAIPA